MQARWYLWLLVAVLPACAQPGGIRGTVVDSRGGEPLATVQVQLTGTVHRAVSDDKGQFQIEGIDPGDYVLSVSTVGYHVAKRAFHLDAGERKEFDVVLSADNLRQTDTVVERTDPFDTARQDSPSALVLAGNDAKNLGSVLADDPLRAVQGLPGVSSNNDFDARFSLRGADYSRIGLYLDGVLLHSPFHMLEGTSGTSGSGTAFNADMVEEMELHSGAYPSRFGDRSAGILDVSTRDGSRTGTTLQIAASASNAGVMAEGPIGSKKRGSWLAAARKSYLQYILARTFPDTSLIFGLEDVQGRFAYDFSPRNRVTFYVLESYSNLDRSDAAQRLGINAFVNAGYHYTFGNAGSRYTPTDKLIVVNHAAWMRERYTNKNRYDMTLGDGYYGEWVWNGSATWMWNSRAPLDGGWSVRRLRDEGFGNAYQSVAGAPRVLDRFNGNDVRLGGYLQQSWMAWSGRLHLAGGARWDHESLAGVAALSPEASASVMIARATRVQLGWGQYVQFPEVSQTVSLLGGLYLLPMRSNHAIAAIEQRVGLRTRLRAEYYNRADRDLIFQPLLDPRILPNGKIFTPPLNPPFRNSLRGYARGVEFFVQRSTANGATGWVSYAFGRTGMRDGVTGSTFPSDWDQRHTVNVFGSYRIKPSVNMSLRWTYGSAFPIPGYLKLSGGQYLLTTARNQLRLPAYQRIDYRVNKVWTHDKWKLTLYGEVINLSNRTNYLFDSFDGYNSRTGQASITLDKMFPILPSAGLVFER